MPGMDCSESNVFTHEEAVGVIRLVSLALVNDKAVLEPFEIKTAGKLLGEAAFSLLPVKSDSKM